MRIIRIFAMPNLKSMRYRLRIIFIITLSFIFLQAGYCMQNEETLWHSSKHSTTMKKIFLCSSFADVASILSKSPIAPSKGKIVAFIPTASIHEEYTQYVEDGKAALGAMGLVVNELEITQCTKDEITKVLNTCDCIYISGGNTFFLMQELRRTGTDKLIIEQVEKGKLYIGESAGAMIFAPNIEYAKKMDDYTSLTPGFNDFTSLGIIDFYPLVHYNSFPFEDATRTIILENSYLPLKPITNQQAIIVIGDSVSIQSRR